ncbi:MAG TPA: PAS domain S-box protein [Chloroflexota bacterium]|nr:PAS domain S-box protein [Chloroflexota bacterium]
MVVTPTLLLGHDGQARTSPHQLDRTASEAPAASAAAAEPPEHPVAAADLGIGVLFDHVLDAVVVAGLTSGTIVLWNRGAEKLFGYTASDAIGRSVEILMPAPLADLHRAGIERYMRTGRGLIVDADAPVEMPAHRQDGESIRVEMVLSELNSAAGQRFAVAVIRDATHRKRLELTNLELVQERVARSDAQSEIAARDELLDALADRLQASPDQAELQRLSAVLTDFRRLHGGQVRIKPEDGELVDLVHAATDAVRRRTPGRRFYVHAPPTVLARFDAANTRQIIEHVLDEALQRSAGGSTIEIRLEQPNIKTALLTVRVQGTGVPRQLGVGLHLSRTLMHRQGGTLTSALTATGGLEVGLTFPGSPHPTHRHPR